VRDSVNIAEVVAFDVLTLTRKFDPTLIRQQHCFVGATGNVIVHREVRRDRELN